MKMSDSLIEKQKHEIFKNMCVKPSNIPNCFYFLASFPRFPKYYPVNLYKISNSSIFLTNI